MTEIKVPLSVFATIYGEDESTLKEALLTQDEEGNDVLSEGAADLLLAKHADRVKSLRGNVKAEVDRKAAKARQEAEEAYKAEMAELKSELEALRNRPAGTESDADRLKREEATKQQIEALKAEYAAELEKERGRFKQGETNARAIKAGMEYFDGLRPILGESPAVAAQRRADFEAMLRQRDYTEPIAGRFVVAADGEAAKDDHDNLLTLEKWVEGLARPRFEFQKQEAKGNGGNTNTPGGNGYAGGLPKTEEEYLKRWFELSDPEEQKKLEVAWNAAKNKTN